MEVARTLEIEKKTWKRSMIVLRLPGPWLDVDQRLKWLKGLLQVRTGFVINLQEYVVFAEEVPPMVKAVMERDTDKSDHLLPFLKICGVLGCVLAEDMKVQRVEWTILLLELGISLVDLFEFGDEECANIFR